MRDTRWRYKLDEKGDFFAVWASQCECKRGREIERGGEEIGRRDALNRRCDLSEAGNQMRAKE
eukprot:3441822-Rhodomonas_salina.1